MGKSLSLDIRERVVTLVGDGFSCREAARRLALAAAVVLSKQVRRSSARNPAL